MSIKNEIAKTLARQRGYKGTFGPSGQQELDAWKASGDNASWWKQATNQEMQKQGGAKQTNAFLGTPTKGADPAQPLGRPVASGLTPSRS